MAWAALSELVPYYPLYALLFLDTGLSGAQISLLFAVWSVTALLTEVPAGALADRWSRRGVLVLGGVLQAAGFVVWTAAPGFRAFLVGFVVWGVAGALWSGAAEALVYDGLAAVGAEESFARVNGAMTAAELLVQVPTAVAAALLYAAGGHELVGWVSVACCLAAAALALRFPEAPRAEDGEDLLDTLRAGVRAAVRTPGLRVVVLAVSLIGGLDAVEEYFPVLADDWGLEPTVVPLAVLAVSLVGALGAWLAGRAGRLPSPALLGSLVAGGGLLFLAGAWARPAALAAVALFYGLYLGVLVVAEARLQERIEGRHRATITSVAGLGVELAALAVFGAWALAGVTGVAVVVLVTVPMVAAGLRLPAREPVDDG
ncbi:MFS transporter [Modestobacter roseus]|uniref:MFS transporter n=1 Tax=Modestobacter roseus TaxID=1181884 RepID=UPI0034DEE44B